MHLNFVDISLAMTYSFSVGTSFFSSIIKKKIIRLPTFNRYTWQSRSVLRNWYKTCKILSSQTRLRVFYTVRLLFLHKSPNLGQWFGDPPLLRIELWMYLGDWNLLAESWWSNAYTYIPIGYDFKNTIENLKVFTSTIFSSLNIKYFFNVQFPNVLMIFCPTTLVNDVNGIIFNYVQS